VGTDTTTVNGTIPHGYVFETANHPPGTAEPLKHLGRFSHEALAFDPRTGIIYQTEDGPSVDSDVDSGVYRFVPRHPRQPTLGGHLQMLKIVGQPRFDTVSLTADGRIFATEWVNVPNLDPDVHAGDMSTFQQGYSAGGASFRRPEGIWYGNGKLFFNCTAGGPTTEGQVFMYDPDRETLQVIFASPAQSVLENPDNIVVAPDGSLLLCEDNAGATTNAAERLVFITRQGEAFTFAVNNLDFTLNGLGPYTRPESGRQFTSNQRQNEWAGATFSPDGTWLFVNIQTPGITFAITGPWTWLSKG
jgi:uncharacterized protein